MEKLFYLLIKYFIGEVIISCSLILYKILSWRRICDKLYGINFLQGLFYILVGIRYDS